MVVVVREELILYHSVDATEVNGNLAKWFVYACAAGSSAGVNSPRVVVVERTAAHKTVLFFYNIYLLNYFAIKSRVDRSGVSGGPCRK